MTSTPTPASVAAPHSSAAAPGSRLDVLVIGAGQSGLAIAWHLSRAGLRFLLVDGAAEIGHGWRSRWDSLRLFTPAAYDALPGSAFPGSPDRYPGKEEVADYLAVYAEEFELPVLLGTTVTRLRREGGDYVAYTSQGVLRATQVVVATGAFQTAVVPATAAGFDSTIPQLHSGEYRSPERLPHGRVLVVGAGNSGRQIAEELAATRRVDLAIGTAPPRLPQRPLGRDLFWWLTRLGLMSRPAGSRLATRIRAKGDLVIGSSDRQLRRAGVSLRPRLDAARGRTAVFADGTDSTVDAVVWATGYRSDFAWVDIEGAAPDGVPVHARGVSPVDGLYFLGLAWQHTRGSSLLGFVGADAAWLAPTIAGRAKVRN